ncbi:MAG: DegT/DnrJ/EryC1/StrS family aminotransferase [Elusimicrobiota bacterium]|jgi:dTDP-4-amino-4,6-dideoxygalactose transaminase
MKTIPLCDLGQEYTLIRKELDPLLEKILSSGSYVLGPESDRFEKTLAAYCEVRHAVGVNSGTDAIGLAARAAGVKPGDEVIVPAMTFIGSIEPVILLGARPIFVDIDPVTYALDAGEVRKKISPKTKAIIAVHLYGMPADLLALQAIAKETGVTLIEDMAQAIGCEFNGRKIGSFGTLACLSFYPTKNLGACGDAGAVLTSDEELADHVRQLRNHGAKIKYQHEEVAYNTRLDDIQAAILRVKLGHLDEWNDRRIQLAREYTRRLAGLPVTTPKELPGRKHTYHVYALQTPRRDALREFLQKRGISSALHYPIPLHLLPALRPYGGREGDFPNSEQLARQMVSIPLYPHMTLDDVGTVSDAIRDFFKTP